MNPPGAPAPLTFRLFGAFHLLRDGQPLTAPPTRKESWLLALLILLADSPVERSYLAGKLWPDAPDNVGLRYLRRSLMELRKSLGPDAVRIHSPTHSTLQIDLSGAKCDLATFDRTVRSSEIESLRRAVDLYRGPLLLGCTEDWIAAPREARHQDLLSALHSLGAHAIETKAWGAAIDYLRRALEWDPMRETTVRALMSALAAAGQHAAAGEAYRFFRSELHRRMNAEPDAETVALSRRIQSEGRDRAAAPSAAAPPSPFATERTARLPAALSRLVGRGAELESIVGLVRKSRAVTLFGAGGMGKTRLSVAVAHAIDAEFADGAHFIELAPLSDPLLLPGWILASLGGAIQPGQSPTAALTAYLKSRRLLLILDNCEHLATHCGRLTLELLQRCPGLRILATSREPLALPGETVWPVPGLSSAEAAELFTERATQARYAFQITGPTSEAIDRICTRLEGIPLAIEMAAARTRGLSAVQIAARLDDVFRLLNQSAGNIEPRHQTLRATLDWSYSLLSSAERTLLARLSFFAGGWTMEAAEAVCVIGATLTRGEIADLLLSLVDRSLVVFGESADGTARYRLLEITRAYAAEHLPAAEYAPLQAALARYLHQLALEARNHWTGPDEKLWLDRLEVELPNIRVALGTPLPSEMTAAQLDLSLPGSLLRLWWRRAHLTEGRRFLESALDRRTMPRTSEPVAAALNAVGVLSNFERHYEAAIAYYLEALAIRRHLQNARGIAATLLNLSVAYAQVGNLDAARNHLEECAQIHRAAGDETKALATERERDRFVNALVGGNANAFQNAEKRLEEAVRSGGRSAEAGVSIELGILCLGLNRLEEAQTYIWRALTLRQEDGDKIGIAAALELTAVLRGRHGRNADVPLFYAAAARLREEIGCPMVEWNRTSYEQNVALCRSSLGDAAFEECWSAGASLSLEEAVIRALQP